MSDRRAGSEAISATWAARLVVLAVLLPVGLMGPQGCRADDVDMRGSAAGSRGSGAGATGGHAVIEGAAGDGVAPVLVGPADGGTVSTCTPELRWTYSGSEGCEVSFSVLVNGDELPVTADPPAQAVCWGDNGNGQSSPKSGPFTALAAGYWHTCALNLSEQAVCWGNNNGGNGQNSPKSGPFTALATGGYHTCALKPDGQAVCWGYNYYGQSSPKSGPFTALAAGYHHTCALSPNEYTAAIPPGSPLLPGSNTWQVKATDCNGTSTLSEEWTFNVNVPAPAAPTLTTPANNATASCDPTLSWTAPALPAGYTYDLLLGKMPPLPVVAGAMTADSYSLSGDERLSNGTYYWQVATVSCTGETAATSSPGTFKVNNTPPTPVLGHPEQSGFTSIIPTFTWTASGAKPDVTYTLYVDGNAVASDIPKTSYKTPQADPLSAGAHTWHVEAVGCMGAKVISGIPRPFSVDTAAPKPFSPILPAHESWTKAPSLVYSWEETTDEGGAGVLGYSVKVGATIVGSTNAATTTLTAAAPATDGMYQWSVTATDNVGNAQQSQVFSLGVDRAPPSVAPGTVALTVGTATPTFTWTPAQDTTSGIATYNVLVNGVSVGTVPSDQTTLQPLEPIAQGTHTYVVRATDKAGNTKDSVQRALIVDLTAPNPTAIVSPCGGYYSSKLGVFEFQSTTDNPGGSGVSHYEIHLDGAKIATVPAGSGVLSTAQFVQEGPRQWFVRAFDKVGLSADSEVCGFIVETDPPLDFAHVSPLSGVTVPTLKPNLCWEPTTDLGSGLSYYEVVITNSQTGATRTETVVPPEGQDTVCTQIEPPALTNGPYTWLVKAYDYAAPPQGTAANGGAAWAMTVNQDTTPPSVTVTSPTAGSIVAGPSVVFEGEAADNTNGSGVAKVELCFTPPCATDEWVLADLKGVYPFYSWKTTWGTATDGQHTVEVRATDKEGNEQDPASHTVKVDLAGPLPFDLTSPGTGTWHLGKPTFQWNATTDAVSGLSHYTLHIWPLGDPSAKQSFDIGTATSHALATSLADGEYNWNVEAVDKMGNKTPSSQTRTIKVDVSGPLAFSLTSESPTVEIAGMRWAKAQTVTLTWSSTSDQGVGMATTPYKVYVNGQVKSTTATTSYTFTAPADGAYTWWVTAADKLGNTTETDKRAFSVDTIGPGVAPVQSFKLTANHIPSNAIDTGITVAPGDAYKLFASGGLCFSDSAKCDEGCFPPDGSPTQGSTISRWPEYTAYNFGQVMLFVGQSSQAYPAGSYAEITFQHAGKLYLTVNDNDKYNCPSKWTSVSIQKANGFNLVSPIHDIYTPDTTPELHWSPVTDAGVGVAKLQVHVNGLVVLDGVAAGSTSVELPEAHALKEGAQTWKIVAIDHLGHVGESNQWTLHVDLTGPMPFALKVPSPGELFETNTPTFQWTAAADSLLADGTPGAGLSHYEVWIDGVFNTAVGIGKTQSEPKAPLLDGAYTIDVRTFEVFHTDEAPRTQLTPPREFTVDTLPPEPFALLSPEPSDLICSTTPTFCWEATTDAGTGLAYYELLIGATSIDVLVGDEPVVCHTMQGALAAGSYAWYVRAHDFAGRARDTETRTFQLDPDVHPPIVAFTSPAPDSCVGPTLTAIGTAVDVGTGCSVGVGSVELSMDGSAWKPAAVDPTTGEWVGVLAMPKDGATTITARATDHELNTTTVADRPQLQVFADVTPPADFALQAPPPNAWTTTTPVFQWQGSADAGCGIAAYTLDIDGGAVLLDVGITTLFALPPALALVEGAHTWRVTAVDGAGFETTSAESSFVVDATPPLQVKTVAPPHLAWVTTKTPVFAWEQATDSYGEVCAYKVKIDNAPAQAVGLVTSYKTAALAEGDHTWSVLAVDCAGNEGPLSVGSVVRVDVTPPSAVVVTYPDAGEAVATAQPTLVWTAAIDAPPATASTVCTYAGTVAGKPFEVSGGQTTFKIPEALADGPVSFQVWAIDCAGNVGLKGPVRSFVVDTTAPVLSASPAGGIFGKAVTVALLVDEPTATIHVELGGAVPGTTSPAYAGPILLDAEVTTLIKAVAIDAAGNSSALVSETYTVDLTPPTVTIAPEGGLFGSPVVVEIAASEAATIYYAIDGEPGPSGQSGASPLEVTVSEEGAHVVTAYAVDLAGHTSATVSASFEIDLTPPVVSIDPPSGSYASAQTVTLTASEEAQIHYTTDGSAPNGTSPIYTKSFELAVEGETTVRALAIDPAEHIGPIVEATITIDFTPPSVSITPSGGAFNAPVSVTLSADEEATVAYTLDGTDPATGGVAAPAPVEIPLAAEGTYLVRAIATDMAGNTGAEAQATLLLDWTAPSLAADPEGGLFAEPVSVVLTSDDETASIHYTLDGADPGLDSPAYDGVIDLDDEGTVVLLAVAIDSAGNLSELLEQTYTVDLTPPSLTVAPPAGAYTQPVAVVLTASEAATVRYTLDGSAPDAASPSGDAPLTIALDAEGTHVVTAVAVDLAGHSSEVVAATYTLDWTAPTVTIAPAAGAYATAQQVVLTPSEPTAVHYTLDGTQPGPTSPVYDAPVPLGDEGSTVVRAVAIDGPGNQGPEATAEIIIDWTQPTGLALLSPADGAWTASSSPSLCWTAATDSLSGIASYELAVDGGATWTGQSTCAEPGAPLGEGAHSWTVLAADAAGNTANAGPATLLVDLTAPSSSIDPVEAHQVGEPVILAGTADDGEGSGVALVEVRVDEGAWVAASPSPTYATWQAPLGALAAGQRVVHARATDGVGLVEAVPSQGAVVVEPDAATVCDDAGELTVGDPTGGTVVESGVLDPGTGCVAGGASGGEVIFEATLAEGRTYRITLTPSGKEDLLFYATTSCADPATGCLLGVDAGGAGEVETAELTLETGLVAAGELVTLYVVVDSAAPVVGDFALLLEEVEPHTGAEVDAGEHASDAGDAVDAASDAASDTGSDAVSPPDSIEESDSAAPGDSAVAGGCGGEGCSAGGRSAFPPTLLLLLVWCVVGRSRSRRRPA